MPGSASPKGSPTAAVAEWSSIVAQWRQGAYSESECDQRLLAAAERHGLSWSDVNDWWETSGAAQPAAPPPPPPPPPPPAYSPTAAGYAVPTVPQLQMLPVPPEALASPARRFGGFLLSALLMVVTLVIGYLIWALIVWKDSTTPAKQILGMRIVDSRSGQPLSYGGMVMRQVVWSLVISIGSSITGGILFVVDALFVFSGSRQRLLDRMSNTLVVRT